MGLSNAQYDAIIRGYQERRRRHAKELADRIQTIYESNPAIRENDEKRSENAIKLAKDRIFNDTPSEDLVKEREALLLTRARLLKEAGLSEADFQPEYTCPDCRDTGFTNGQKCHCFLKQERALLYENSHMDAVLSRENFSTLRYDLYDRTPKGSSKSVFDEMRGIIESLRVFVETFPENGKNLLFYGPPGTGKTFLTNCIAKALMDRGYSVVYFSAISLFEQISRVRFGRDDKTADPSELLPLYESDLLIIDDLGTELTNSFVQSELFHVVNERILRKKSTIISTNMNLSSLAEHYSERTASRIVSFYDAIQLTGEDLRVKIKLEERSRRLGRNETQEGGQKQWQT